MQDSVNLLASGAQIKHCCWFGIFASTYRCRLSFFARANPPPWSLITYSLTVSNRVAVVIGLTLIMWYVVQYVGHHALLQLFFLCYWRRKIGVRVCEWVSVCCGCRLQVGQELERKKCSTSCYKTYVDMSVGVLAFPYIFYVGYNQ